MRDGMILYVYNIGRIIHIELDDIHIEYTGPKNLVRFIKINKFDFPVICIETQFSGGIEEDYIDLEYLFKDYNVETLLSNIKDIKIKDK